MKRLTEYVNGTPAIILHKLDFHFQANGAIGGDIARKLAAYEETGLEPEEIERIVDAYGRGHTLRTDAAERLEIIREIQTGRLRELARAEKDGRVLTPPCKVGDTAYCILEDAPAYYPDTDGWYISEETVHEITTKGLILHEVEDGANVYVEPFDQIGKTVFLIREEAAAALERKLVGK